MTENGWPIITSDQLDRSPVPGTNIVPVPGTLGGDVGWLLRWVGQQFNQKVAALYNPGCWGWNAPTPIPGTNVYSNHCSGTAIDFNAPSFPWKVQAMTESQRQACRDIAAQTEYVVVWGGDFTTYIDEMHFEIAGTPEQVAAIVRKLKGDDMVENTDAWYTRTNRLHRQAVGSELPRSRFVNEMVGLSWIEVTDRISNNADADRNTGMADLGRRVVDEKWLQNIRDLNLDVTNLKEGGAVDKQKLARLIENANKLQKSVEELKK